MGEDAGEGLKSLFKAIKDNPGIKAKDLKTALGGRPIKTIERQIKTLVNGKFSKKEI